MKTIFMFWWTCQ